MKKLLRIMAIALILAIPVTAQAWDRDKEIRDADKPLTWYVDRYLTPTYSLAASPRGTHVTKSFSYIQSGTRIVGISLTSNRIDCQKLTGYFGLQLAITGTGTASIGYMASNDGLTYRMPEGVTYFATGLGWTSGDESDGRVYLSFEPAVAESIILYITETGYSGSITVTHAKLARQ